MDLFPVNSTVSITMPIVDLNGNPVVPTGLSYAVLDENYEELVAATSLFGSFTTGDTHAQIVIGPSHNIMSGPRVVLFTVTDAAGNQYVFESYYGLVPVRRLTVLTNTFQSHVSALYLSQSMPSVAGWTAASQADQEMALIEGFTRLIRMNFVIPYPEMVDTQALLDPDYYAEITPRMWPRMTPDLFARYPASFSQALCKAQVAEANHILTGDPIADKIRSGLFSEKVGESSMMFRSGIRPVTLPMCREALEYMTGFLNNRVTLSRI